MTEEKQKTVGILVVGVFLLLLGLFGIYYQGPFWASDTVACMNPGEDAVVFGLPAGTTVVGTLLLSYVLLASPLTAHWTSRKRLIIFITFGAAVLIGCGITASVAGKIAAKKLQTTEAPAPWMGMAIFHPASPLPAVRPGGRAACAPPSRAALDNHPGGESGNGLRLCACSATSR